MNEDWRSSRETKRKKKKHANKSLTHKYHNPITFAAFTLGIILVSMCLSGRFFPIFFFYFPFYTFASFHYYQCESFRWYLIFWSVQLLYFSSFSRALRVKSSSVWDFFHVNRILCEVCGVWMWFIRTHAPLPIRFILNE